MKISRDSTEELLQAILRGAAKILGCNSTNLVLFNEHTGEIRIEVGAMAVSYPVLESIEGVLGKSFSTITLPIERARGSMVYRCWRERDICETSDLVELAGETFGSGVTEQLAELAGPHRFICVPALSGNRNYGVLLFTKVGTPPFSTQQREVLLRYARRIGEIIESNLSGQHRDWPERMSSTGPEYLILDVQGRLIGGAEGRDASSPVAGPEVIGRIGQHVRQLMATSGATSALHDLDGRHRLGLTRLTLEGRDVVLCQMSEVDQKIASSLEHQLLQLSLGEPAPALFIDADFGITSCNPATEQLFGYARGELVGRPISELFRAPERILEILIQQALDPATPYSEESVTVVRKDGSFAPARLEALHLADGMRQAVGFLVVVRESDETAEHGSDRLLVQARLATMGELATQLAHEIRNPLLAIGATLNYLREETLDEEHQRILAQLSREIGRLDMTLKDYLAARHEFSFSQIAVEELVAQAARLLGDARRRAGNSIRVDVPPGFSVWGDHDALKHVLFNLLLNALEATPDGAPVVCRAESDPSGVVIVVDDQGTGLSVAPERCFQPFFTTKKHGSGLGLAVCHKIVRAHGGTVQLANMDGGGCRATLLLPHRPRAEQ